MRLFVACDTPLVYEYSYAASDHHCKGLILNGVAPRHGFERRLTAPKAAVLPLDDRGMAARTASQCSVPSSATATATIDLVQSRLEASLGRCWVRASNPLCGTLCRRWVRLPLASAT